MIEHKHRLDGWGRNVARCVGNEIADGGDVGLQHELSHLLLKVVLEKLTAATVGKHKTVVGELVTQLVVVLRYDLQKGRVGHHNCSMCWERKIKLWWG